MGRSVRFIVVIVLFGMQSMFAGKTPLAVRAQDRGEADRSPLQVAIASDGMHIIWTLVHEEQMAELPLRWPMPDGRALPYLAWLVALPAEATAESVTVEAQRFEIALRSSLDLSQVEETSPLLPLPTGWPTHVEPAGVMRGVQLARVLLFPARPSTDGWQILTVLHAHVRWPTPGDAYTPFRSASPDPLLSAVATQVVNPSSVVNLYPPVPDRQPSSVALQRSVFIDVARSGLVSVTRAMLDAAGFVVSSPHTLHLRQGAQEVLMFWEGDADDVFEPDERLLFYAQPRFSRYANHDTWVLEDVGRPSPRMSTRDATRGELPEGTLWGTFLFERNLIYMPECGCHGPVGRDGDRWAWVSLQRGQTWSSSLALPPTTTGSATLVLWLIGYTDVPQSPDHRIQVWLNGDVVGEAIWDGRQAITATFAVTLAPLANTLSITLPGLLGVNVEGAWVDALAVMARTDSIGLSSHQPLQGDTTPHTYRLGFVPAYLLDVTTPTQPVRLINWQPDGSGIKFGDPADGWPRTYAAFTETLAPSHVRAPVALDPAQGDLHVVAHPDVLPALAPLIARRRSQGFTIVVQTPQALYDHYGEGRMDPAAIRAYFAARYRGDTLRPTYALIVGDGTFDPKRYNAASPPTLLPALLADVDPFLGETAADNRFVTVDGDDALPDIALGRWPTNTFTETQQLVSKTLAYEDVLSTPAKRRVLFVADNADAAGNFPARAQSLASIVPTPYLTVTALMKTPLAFTATRKTLLSHWSDSQLIVFVGHSSPRQWAAERLFHRDDVPSLLGDSGLPVVVGLTCYTSRFHELQSTLDETLLRASERGAVGTWGATGLTIAGGHEPLGRGFINVWLGGGRLGDATLAGKLRLATGGLYLDLLDTYTLLGDPTLLPNQRWATQAIYLPTMQR